MHVYNFKPQFAPLVESGKKLCTIRQAGKRPPPKPGVHLRLFTGMRTKNCRKLRDAMCSWVQMIMITPRDGVFLAPVDSNWNFSIPLTKAQAEELAHRDGHENLAAMIAFFCPNKNTAFTGHLIEWL